MSDLLLIKLEIRKPLDRNSWIRELELVSVIYTISYSLYELASNQIREFLSIGKIYCWSIQMLVSFKITKIRMEFLIVKSLNILVEKTFFLGSVKNLVFRDLYLWSREEFWTLVALTDHNLFERFLIQWKYDIEFDNHFSISSIYRTYSRCNSRKSIIET